VFSIVSPNHDKTARPGAISLACNNSKSPATTNDRNHLKVPATSRYPLDPVEEDWPPAYSVSRPKHRSSLRRICRFFVDIHRMYDRRIVNTSHNEPPPPPYEQFQRQELPASSLHEFPDPLLTTPELHGHALMFELEGSMPKAGSHFISCGVHPGCSSHIDATNTWAPDVGHVMPQPLMPIQTSRLPWNLNTEQYLAPLPGMVSGGQSHQSSPSSISPITPNLDVTCVPQLCPPFGFPDGTISPQSLVSPPDNYWEGPPAFPLMHGYTSHSSFRSTLELSPMEPPGACTQSTEQSHLPHALASFSNPPPSVNSVAPYAMSNQHSWAPQSSVVHTQGQWHGTNNVLPGMYEHHGEPGWHYRPSHEPNSNEDDSRQTWSSPVLHRHDNHSEEHQHAVPIHAGNGYDHAPPVRPLPQAGEVNEFPPEPCGKCNKVFHGRYANLLDAHVQNGY
jgi:hypothetical protein